jgi:hypothetical protein
VGDTPTLNSFRENSDPVLFGTRVSEKKALRGLLPILRFFQLKRKAPPSIAGFPAVEGFFQTLENAVFPKIL